MLIILVLIIIIVTIFAFLYILRNKSKTDCLIILSGGLGNQLFMVFSALDYSVKHNKKLKILWNNNETKRPKYFDSILSKFQKYVVQSYEKPVDLYREQKFSYKQIPTTQNNIILHGYFQSSKYFTNIRDNIVNMLNFSDSSKIFFIESIKSKLQTPVILHVRRTDYLALPNYHTVQNLEYYKEAIEIIRKNVKNPHFFLISDDVEFLKNIPIEEREKTIVDQTDINTMHLMSLCRHFIIANSSFSWWGAVLGGYDLVVAPKNWFGSDGPQDWQDIYEPDWIVI